MTAYYDDQPWLKTYPQWFSPDFTAPPESVLAKFKRAVNSYPDDPCIYYFDSCYSFAQVDKMASAFAAALAETGLKQGDRMLFVLQNIPQAVIGALAVWMRGGNVVSGNPM